MTRSGVTVVSLLFAVAVCLHVSAQAQENSGAADTNLHGIIPVTLAKSLDSKKLKEGDEVTAKTTVAMRFPNGLEVPKGTDVVGHVTQAKARSKGDSESSLGITFDKIQLAGGKSLDMKGMIQAVGPNPSADSGPETGSMMGGNNMNTGNGSTAATGTGMGMQGDKANPKMLNPKSTGVVGIKNLKLENSVLTSSGKDVKLDSGAQIMIHAQ
jgi:hypothetical protein